jgi:hypothetical protein
LVALFPLNSQAYPIIYATGPTTISPTGTAIPVNVQASISFDYNAHTMTVQLINLEANPTSVPQLLAGVEVDFADLGSGSLNGSIASTSASTFSLDTNGNPTAAPTPVTSTTWQVQSAVSQPSAGYASNTLALCEICKINGNGPAELIIGGPDPNLLPTTDSYTNANSGVKNNSHNPLILGSGASYSGGTFAGANTTPSWVLNTQAIQSTTTIVAVRFYFGSAYSSSQETDATIEIAPEPGAGFMVAGGVLLIAVGAWRRRR